MPLRTEYSCRLKEPEEFQKKSFRRIASGDVDLIIARPHGMKKTRAQAIRYPRELWDEKDAKRRCKKRKGKFEPVSPLSNLSGGWVEDAIEYGWWDNLEQLKSYEGDVAYDAREAHPSFKEEIEDDLALIRKRVQELEIEKSGQEMGLTRKQIEVAIKEGVTSPVGMRRIAKNVPFEKPAQNVQTVPFDSQLFDCYGKQTKRGFRAYCRRK